MAGRPTKYQKSYNEMAYKLSLLGYVDKELAIFFEVDESTINNWKVEYPEFLESIKNGKEIADIEVTQSLRRRALGYTATETYTDENGNIKTTEKEVAPDTTAAIFWLKNRQPAKWRDKKDIGLEGDLVINWHEEKTYDSKRKADGGD